MSIVKEISIKCDGDGCVRLLDLHTDNHIDALVMAREHGWHRKHIRHRMRDYCPECLVASGFSTRNPHRLSLC